MMNTKPIGTPVEGGSSPREKVIFKDGYGLECSVQGLAARAWKNEDEDVGDEPLGEIWLGLEEAHPQILKSDCRRLGIPYEVDAGGHNGWASFQIPPEVLLSTRAHLDEQQVRDLVARLQHWLRTGHILTECEGNAIPVRETVDDLDHYKCAVSCCDSNGAPTFFFCEVMV